MSGPKIVFTPVWPVSAAMNSVRSMNIGRRISRGSRRAMYSTSAWSGMKGAVTMVGHGIGGNPGIIVRARATAIGAGVPLNAVSVSPLRITLWCDRPHVDDLTRALHKAFVES